jgi:hypothetical protein
MKYLNRISVSVAALLLAAGQASAVSAQSATDSIEPLRPVTSSYMIEAGSSHLADTYLTPLRYSGWHVGLAYQRQQAMKFNPDNWVMELYGNLRGDRTLNPARNSTLWNLDLEFRWGMMRRYEPIHSLTLAVGPATGLDVGALYMVHNGNNPVAVKAAWNVAIQGLAAYNITFKRLPVTFSYHVYMPAAGVFFSPDYAELYYEIYLGNHSDLAHFAWWKNYFRMDNLVTADIHLGGTTLRLGYKCDVRSTKINSLVTRDVTHTAVVGVTTQWLSLNPRHPLSTDARVIQSIY